MKKFRHDDDKGFILLEILAGLIVIGIATPLIYSEIENWLMNSFTRVLLLMQMPTIPQPEITLPITMPLCTTAAFRQTLQPMI